MAKSGGFLIEAWGDLAKSVGKARQGEDALITGGIFRFFRHPNYTGEIIGWVSSCIAAFLSVAATNGFKSLSVWKSMAPSLVACVLGASGISFVLTTATAGLESRQLEKYGDTEEYKDWVKKSWVGFQMAKSTNEVEEEEESNEEGGDSPATSED
uniref:Steroid 5-alpha reductase C-terminal domain-containing protein n=1 Tax=Helicotheca tamesis TaxID=374047 RepID=A0A7S2N270_9STRA